MVTWSFLLFALNTVLNLSLMTQSELEANPSANRAKRRKSHATKGMLGYGFDDLGF